MFCIASALKRLGVRSAPQNAEGLIHIVEKAKRLKNRNILMEMKRES